MGTFFKIPTVSCFFFIMRFSAHKHAKAQQEQQCFSPFSNWIISRKVFNCFDDNVRNLTSENPRILLKLLILIPRNLVKIRKECCEKENSALSTTLSKPVDLRIHSIHVCMFVQRLRKRVFHSAHLIICRDLLSVARKEIVTFAGGFSKCAIIIIVIVCYWDHEMVLTEPHHCKEKPYIIYLVNYSFAPVDGSDVWLTYVSSWNDVY